PASLSSTLFPYTTLFRSVLNPSFHYTYPGDFITTVSVGSPIGCVSTAVDSVHIVPPVKVHAYKDTVICIGGSAPLYATGAFTYRSEEHTSELQSQSNLVC